MQQSSIMSSVSFSPQLIELKQKIIQPSILSTSQPHLNHIDTQRLKKVNKDKHQILIDPLEIQRKLLRSIEPKVQLSPKIKQKPIRGIIDRERYILPPVKNIRRALKESSFKEKNQEILNSYLNKQIVSLITPDKKKCVIKEVNKNSVDYQLSQFLRKSKSRNRKVIYYRPEQVKKRSQTECAYQEGSQQVQTKHFQSQNKLQMNSIVRKRTKTQLKTQSYQQQYDFFKLKTCFNQPNYASFLEIFNFCSLDQSKLNGPHRILSIPKQEDLKEFINRYEPVNEEIQIKSLLKSNFCSVQFGKHQVYVGEMSGKVRSGIGILFTEDYCFEGLWKNNQMIKGVEITKEGIYKGTFHQNRREGKGEFEWRSGELYVGEWLKGYQHGDGLWINTRGESYNGQWKHGKPEGIGNLKIKSTQHSKSARKYKGGFVNGKQQGFGRETFKNGDSYEGMYKDDRPSGKGTYTWADGSTYEGDFQGGLRMGMGVLKTSFRLIYKGQFYEDTPTGQCQIILPNGDLYYGMVKDGKKNGKGTLHIRKSKQVFNGYWKNDDFVNRNEQASKIER